MTVYKLSIFSFEAFCSFCAGWFSISAGRFFGLVSGGWLFRVWLFMIFSEESDYMLSSFLPHAPDMENGHPDLSRNDRHEEKIKRGSIINTS